MEILFDVEFEGNFTDSVNGLEPVVTGDAIIETGSRMFGNGCLKLNATTGPSSLVYTPSEETKTIVKENGFSASLFVEPPASPILHYGYSFEKVFGGFNVRMFLEGTIQFYQFLTDEEIDMYILYMFQVTESSEYVYYIDGYQIIKGALWTSDFTPPTEPFSSEGVSHTLTLADSFILTDVPPGNQAGGNADGFIPALILDRLSIEPYAPTMIVGQSQQTGAIGYYNFNTIINLTQSTTWVSSNPTVATIDSNGLIIAVSTGITFIRATYGSTSTYIMLKVEQAVTVSTVTGSYTYQQIPLTPDPNQTFSCTLLIDGKNIPIDFQLHWNAQANYWVMTLINSASSTYYVDSIPLIAGVQPTINILQPYSYLKIGSCYIINISGIASDYPTDDNLGIDYIMLWGDTENI